MARLLVASDLLTYNTTMAFMPAVVDLSVLSVDGRVAGVVVGLWAAVKPHKLKNLVCFVVACWM